MQSSCLLWLGKGCLSAIYLINNSITHSLLRTSLLSECCFSCIDWIQSLMVYDPIVQLRPIPYMRTPSAYPKPCMTSHLLASSWHRITLRYGSGSDLTNAQRIPFVWSLPRTSCFISFRVSIHLASLTSISRMLGTLLCPCYFQFFLLIVQCKSYRICHFSFQSLQLKYHI